MAKHFEVLLFTASTMCYAEAIVNSIDPSSELISYILPRKHCMRTKNGLYIKDLRIIKNRELKNIVIVDNLC